MRISELTSKTGLSYSTDATDTFLVINSGSTPVTYKIDLTELRAGMGLVSNPIFANSITIGSTTITEAQLRTLLGLEPLPEPDAEPEPEP